MENILEYTAQIAMKLYFLRVYTNIYSNIQCVNEKSDSINIDYAILARQIEEKNIHMETNHRNSLISNGGIVWLLKNPKAMDNVNRHRK